MIVITTPAGHIGCPALEDLQGRSEQFRLVARDLYGIPAACGSRVIDRVPTSASQIACR